MSYKYEALRLVCAKDMEIFPTKPFQKTYPIYPSILKILILTVFPLSESQISTDLGIARIQKSALSDSSV